MLFFDFLMENVMTKVIFYVVGYLIEAILSFVFYFFIVKKEINVI